jgi:site-specific DNA-cytosine methylase
LGYSVRAEVVAFSRFGAPTLRERWVLVALRGGRPSKVFRELKGMTEEPPRPIDLISDLPREPDGANDHRAPQIRSGIRDLIPLIPLGHSLTSAYRAGLIPHSAVAKRVRDVGKKHSYWLYRVPVEGLMKVIPHPRRSMALHPIYDRALSVRELARLMTYTDSFKPLGVDRAMRAIAESVPPRFSCKLALALAHAIGSACRSP